MTSPAQPRVTIKLRRRAKRDKAHAQEQLQQRLADERKRAGLARKHTPVNASLLALDNSFDTPDFVALGAYIDRPFTCKKCGKLEVWTGMHVLALPAQRTSTQGGSPQGSS